MIKNRQNHCSQPRNLRITLKSSPDADLHDHAFTSPTFKEHLEGHITTYIKSGGKKF